MTFRWPVHIWCSNTKNVIHMDLLQRMVKLGFHLNETVGVELNQHTFDRYNVHFICFVHRKCKCVYIGPIDKRLMPNTNALWLLVIHNAVRQGYSQTTLTVIYTGNPNVPPFSVLNLNAIQKNLCRFVRTFRGHLYFHTCRLIRPTLLAHALGFESN